MQKFDKLKKGQLIELYIDDYSFGGNGLSRLLVEDKPIVAFTPNAIPGSKILARIFKIRKNHLELKYIKKLEKSELEIDNNYQEVSGAPFINLDSNTQKKYKLNSTLEVYKRISKISNIDTFFDEYIESPNLYFYRNKMEYSFSSIEYDFEKNIEIDDSFALGFKKRGTWWLVENLKKSSGLFDKDVEDKLYIIKNYLLKTNLPAWHPPKKNGFYRYFTVRKSFFNNNLLFNIITTSDNIDDFNIDNFIKLLLDLFGDRIQGILHTISDENGERSTNNDNVYKIIYGVDFIEEKILDLYFKININSFFQTNPLSAEKLYNKSINYIFDDIQYNEDEYILDLFCGTGTITQLVASKSKSKIIGVDLIKDAIVDAENNAFKNKIENIEFIVSDVKDFLYKNNYFVGKIKTIILDPPRAGIVPKALGKIIELNAKRIVYISCNPATQARDLIEFINNGYQIKMFSLIDQFPHTSHIESVFLLEKH